MRDRTTVLSLFEQIQGLSPEDQEALEKIVNSIAVTRGTLLYRPEDTSDTLFFLLQGIVQFYRISSEGKKRVIFTLNDAGLFGERSLFGQKRHTTFAEAFTDCSLFVIKRDDLLQVMATRPQLAMRLLTTAGHHLRRAEESLEALAFKSIPVRLVERLLLLANDQDMVVGLTHQDLADMIGTYRETTTQTLNDLKAAGLITIGRRRLTLLDKAGLQAFARQ